MRTTPTGRAAVGARNIPPGRRFFLHVFPSLLFVVAAAQQLLATPTSLPTAVSAFTLPSASRQLSRPCFPPTRRDDDDEARPRRRPVAAAAPSALVPSHHRLATRSSRCSRRGASNIGAATAAACGEETRRNNHPRLARALEAMFGVVVRLLLGRCSSISVTVAAPSNRSLLRGKFDRVAVSVRDSRGRFGLLRVSGWDMRGEDLDLGYVPLMIATLVTAVPFLIWKMRRLNLLSWWLLLFFGAKTLRNGGGPPTSVSVAQSSHGEVLGARLARRFGARPTSLAYSLTLTDEDLSESKVLQFGLRSILRSLMMNSVVGAAAALGDAVTMLNGEEEVGNSVDPKQAWSSVPLLPQRDGRTSGGNTPEKRSEGQQGALTTLLSATSFDLNGASFSNGRLSLDAEAVLPDDDGDSRRNADGARVPRNGHDSIDAEKPDLRTRLEFTVRTKMQPTTIYGNAEASYGQAPSPKVQSQNQQQEQELQHALAFAAPECRISLADVKTGSSLFDNFIPDVVWLPVGAGVAVPLYRNQRILQIDTGKDGFCQIDGRVSFFGDGKQSLERDVEMTATSAPFSLLSLPPGERSKSPPARLQKQQGN